MAFGKFIAAFLSTFVCIISAYADEAPAPSSGEASSPALEAGLETPRNKTEGRWFFYLSAGLGNPSYDSGIQSRINDQKSRGGESPFAGSFDLPGAYRRVGGGWAVGGVLNMMFENVAVGSWKNGDSFSIQIFNPSLSAMYFPGGTIGLGWFGRTDLGMSRILQVRQEPTAISRLNDTGVIGQIAFGYGLRGGDVCHVLTHLNAFYSSASERHATGLMFHVGFLL